MSNWMTFMDIRYKQLTAALSTLEPLVLVLFRVWVALVFWRAGVVKFSDPNGTSYLFNNE